ncbi:MAG: hypothetical protein JSV00_02225 [bacterium]|nr:MAG: hypothetical protein JSV00_02225 [bacterium]
MSLVDYFRPVPSMTPEEVRAFMDSHDPEQFNLVDVRQPGEYRQGHLPGAKLIPMGDLEARLGEMDPAKPTIAY